MQDTKYIDIITNLSSVHIIINKRIDAVLGSIHGISYTEFLILNILYKSRNYCLSRTLLANEIGLTPSGITRSISPMVKIGLVEKDINERDSRMSLVKLTEAGERIYKESSFTVNEKVQNLLFDLKDEFFDNALIILKNLQRI